jgi:hypothetical protein
MAGTSALWMSRDAVMAFAADHELLLDRLDEELRDASGPTLELFSKVIAAACTRLPTSSRFGKEALVGHLIKSSAWTDAVFALIEVELPDWTIRRLVCENGLWLCSLSQQPNLPAAMDDTVDACHEMLPLAVLRAFVEARRRRVAAGRSVVSVPQFRPMVECTLCCDNFA